MSEARQAATRVVRTLQDHGRVAYFAGGCVRDELLGQDPEDYDVATDATPDLVERLFRKTKSVGKAFGVVLVRDGRIVTEVATFREESGYSDKRRPDEVRFADAEADARRRDFTINALFRDPLDTTERPAGRIVDLVGGEADLQARVVRAVGDPEARLAEDHLRALRAVRFTARLGFVLDDATAGAIRAHAAELEGVSRERVGDEVRRILAHPTRGAGARLMQRLGLDAPALHDAALPDEPTPALDALRDDAGATLALAAWTADRLRAHGAGPKAGDALPAVRRLRSALVLANEECEDLRALLETVVHLRDDWQGAGVARRKRWAASPHARGALDILGAHEPGRAAAVVQEIADLAATPGGLAPQPLIKGDDLIGAGFRPGPLFGTWLESAYDAQLEGRITTRDEAIAFVREMPGAGPKGDPGGE